MLEWRRMNAIAKTSTFVLVLLATMPFAVGAVSAVGGLGAILTLNGCDKFKKGDGDAASDAAPAATTVDTAPTGSATPSATTITTPTWHAPVRVDGGVKLGDAGVVKLGDGGMAAPIPTPVPTGTLAPPAFPTTIPTTLPPGFPSSLPPGFPSVLPQPKPKP